MVLLVVDTQEMIVTSDLYEYEKFVTNVKLLLRAARDHQVEVIYVTHDDGYELTKGNDGFEIYQDFAPQEEEKIFEKHVNSAFKESGLLEYLESKKEKQVMIVGLQTDFCIDATIKCGFEHGLEMFVPAFCNTSIDNEFMTGEQTYYYYNAKMWNKRYARGIDMEEALGILKA